MPEEIYKQCSKCKNKKLIQKFPPKHGKETKTCDYCRAKKKHPQWGYYDEELNEYIDYLHSDEVTQPIRKELLDKELQDKDELSKSELKELCRRRLNQDSMRYYQENKEKCLQYGREYREKNRELLKKQAKVYNESVRNPRKKERYHKETWCDVCEKIVKEGNWIAHQASDKHLRLELEQEDKELQDKDELSKSELKELSSRRVNQNSKRYYQENKEKCLQYSSEYKEKNKELLKKKAKVYDESVRASRAREKYHKDIWCDVCEKMIKEGNWIKHQARKKHLLLELEQEGDTLCMICKTEVKDSDFEAHMKTHNREKNRELLNQKGEDYYQEVRKPRKSEKYHRKREKYHKETWCDVCKKIVKEGNWIAHQTTKKHLLLEREQEDEMFCKICKTEVKDSEYEAHMKIHQE